MAAMAQMVFDLTPVSEPKRKRAMTDRQKQREKQKARLAKECCPIHGIGLTQVSHWYVPLHGRPYTYGKCPRRDCHFVGRTFCNGDPVVPATAEEAYQ